MLPALLSPLHERSPLSTTYIDYHTSESSAALTTHTQTVSLTDNKRFKTAIIWPRPDAPALTCSATHRDQSL